MVGKISLTILKIEDVMYCDNVIGDSFLLETNIILY